MPQGKVTDSNIKTLIHRQATPDFVCLSELPGIKEDGAIGYLEGYASTNEVDSYNDIVEPEAFREAMSEYMKFPIILFGHRWGDKPIGKVIDFSIDAKGLWVRVALADTVEGQDVKSLIDFGILKSFSIGFWILKYEDNSGDGKPNRILKLKLAEISVVNRPANQGALFEQVAQQQLSLKSINQISRRDGNGGLKMEPNEVKSVVEPLVTQVKTELSGLIESQGRTIKAHIDAQEAANAGTMTKQEFATFSEKIGKDMLANSEALARIEKAKKLDHDALPVADFRGSIRSLIDYRDDNGIPWSDAQKREFRLMQMPFKKDGSATSEILKEIRDANDVLVILSAMHRANGQVLNMKETKSFKRIQELSAHIDPEFSKSMYVGSGVGTEWVPTGYSGELFDLIYLEAKVASLFPSFTMTQNPYIWPIKTGRPTVYRAPSVSTNSPDSLVRSDGATNKITFTAELFAAATLMDPVLMEDSIIGILETIRGDHAIAHALADDSRIINADDTATHQDNASATRWASTSPETYEKGLRKIALAASYKSDAQSTSAGVGNAAATFVAQDLRYARQKCGVLGIDPAKFAYIVSPRTYFQMLSFTEQTQGQLYYLMAGTWKTGNLNLPFDGCEVVVTSGIDENQAATGLYTDGVTYSTFTTAIGVRKDAFKRGQRRQITVEVAKDISTQGVLLVSTKRESFQRLAPSAQTPVWVVYNIPA